MLLFFISTAAAGGAIVSVVDNWRGVAAVHQSTDSRRTQSHTYTNHTIKLYSHQSDSHLPRQETEAQNNAEKSFFCVSTTGVCMF